MRELIEKRILELTEERNKYGSLYDCTLKDLFRVAEIDTIVKELKYILEASI